MIKDKEKFTRELASLAGQVQVINEAIVRIIDWKHDDEGWGDMLPPDLVLDEVVRRLTLLACIVGILEDEEFEQSIDAFIMAEKLTDLERVTGILTDMLSIDPDGTIN